MCSTVTPRVRRAPESFGSPQKRGPVLTARGSLKLIRIPATAPVPGLGTPPYLARWADTLPGFQVNQRLRCAAAVEVELQECGRPDAAPWMTDRWASGAPTQAAVTLYRPVRVTVPKPRIRCCWCYRSRPIRRTAARPVSRGRPRAPTDCGIRRRRLPDPGSEARACAGYERDAGPEAAGESPASSAYSHPASPAAAAATASTSAARTVRRIPPVADMHRA